MTDRLTDVVEAVCGCAAIRASMIRDQPRSVGVARSMQLKEAARLDAGITHIRECFAERERLRVLLGEKVLETADLRTRLKAALDLLDQMTSRVLTISELDWIKAESGRLIREYRTVQTPATEGCSNPDCEDGTVYTRDRRGNIDGGFFCPDCTTEEDR